MNKAASLIIPSDAETLVVDAMRDDMPQNPVEDKLEEILRVCPKGSREI